MTIEADDPCYYMCWNRERLQYYLEANPKLEGAMHYVRGKDVLQKVAWCELVVVLTVCLLVYQSLKKTVKIFTNKTFCR